MNALGRFALTCLVGIAALLVALQIAAGFFLKPILEREGRRIFRVPVHMDRAGANLFAGSVWMKGVRVKNVPGFGEPNAFFARTMVIDLNVLSLLTSEFVIGRILLKDPVITVEISEQGEMNMSQLVDNAVYRVQKFLHKKRKFVRLVTRYELEKFQIRRGTLQFVDARQAERDWTWGSISFSLARVVYPPDPQEALPVAVYLNATVQGTQEGQLLLIGRFNPLAPKQSFDITGSAKHIFLSEYNYFLPDFPLRFTEGVLDVKVKALCHENQLDVHHQIRINRLRLAVDDPAPLAFGLPPETVANFFNELWPKNEPIEFDFRVTGDLTSASFSTILEIKKQIHQAIHDRITGYMNKLVGAAKPVQGTAPLPAEPRPPA